MIFVMSDIHGFWDEFEKRKAKRSKNCTVNYEKTTN